MHKILDSLHHFLLPRESNNHRAKILHHSSLLALVALLLLTQFAFTLTEKRYPDVLGVTNNISVDDLVRLTNQKRQENGLSTLTFNAELSSAASQKAQHMLANNYWAHNAPDGTTPWGFFKSVGYEYIFAGENLARGFSTTDDVMNAWMASTGHRENIMSPNYKEIGFAVVTGNLTGEETVLVVEMFGSRNTNVAQETQSIAVLAPVTKPSLAPLQLATRVIPTPIPSLSIPSPAVTLTERNESPGPKDTGSKVASIKSRPLINEQTLSKNITVILVVLLLLVLTFDLFIVERKKIVRLVSHNIDHIIFLSIILITILLFGKGLIL